MGASKIPLTIDDGTKEIGIEDWEIKLARFVGATIVVYTS